MADNLKAIGMAAGLTPEEQKRIDDYQKALAAHKELLNLPQDVAQQVFNKKTPAEQASLVQNFGTEDPSVKPQRGWLGTAFHYTFGNLGSAIGAAGRGVLAGLQNVSDFSTRVARTGLVALDQGVGLNTAWDIANDKGDKVFSPDRISNAKSKWGQDAVDVAMRIASGEKPEEIFKSATPEQQKYIMLASPTNKSIPGIPEGDVEAARANFQNTLDEVNAAKYSPGRFVANLITPRELEGSGLFYKAVSGAVDAAYRVLADPLLVAGKAKRLYDVSKYALDVTVGANKVADVFSQPNVINFWDQYGAKLKDLKTAQTTGKVEDAIKIRKDLQIMAPELGPATIQSFIKADQPIIDAKSAQAFFENTKQLDEMLKGGVGRQRVIIPRMDPLRQARIAAVTTGRKVFNLNAVGPKFVDDYWYGGATDADGIIKTITDGKEQFINQVKASTDSKGIARFSTKYIQQRIDRAKAKFTLAPLFKDDVFDVTAPDASDKIYRLAVMVMPKRESKLLSEAFNSIEEVGKRKNVYYGLWNTISEVRGLNNTLPGQQITRYLTGKSEALFGLDDAFRDKGALPSDFNNFVSAPSLSDLDAAAARNTLFQKLMGIPNTKLAENMVSAWSFLTLAGPRYALRNAGEDLMFNLAIGKSPWGIAKNRYLSSRINTFYAAAKQADGSLKWYDNPLGMAMRFVNKKEVDNVAQELTGLKTKFDTGQKELASLKRQLKEAEGIDAGNIQLKINELENSLKGGLDGQVRQIFARTLSQGRINKVREKLGLKPMLKDEVDLLSEQLQYGNLDNALGEISESSSNFASGTLDYVNRAQKLQRETGTGVHALTITPSKEKYVKKPGERAFTPIALDPQSEASIFSWMSRIGYYANDDLGKIAVANLDNQEEFLTQARNWLQTKNGQKYLKDARLSSNLSEDQLLNLAFTRSKQLFSKRNGDVNLDLLNKIRIKDNAGQYKVSGSLSIDDMPTNADDIPNVIIGPTLVPAVEANRITSSVMQHNWTFLGLSNARMSRQPLVLNEMVNIRKQMRETGFEQKWIDSHLQGIDRSNPAKVSQATEKAKQELAKIVEDRAVGEILQYVDNPLVRTQIAFASRNFARFYRATEDFYRRMYRLVRYNPEALVKAALTYEGVTHSGWVQKDDQGNDYFVYPGIAPVYNAVQNALSKIGLANQFKTPFPVEFGAQVKMLTPSINPDSLLPTFSGPLAGISVTTLSGLLNFFKQGETADAITGYALGKYAVDRPVLSALMPAHINRLIGAMDTDERNSQYASAWRKAVTYLEASGHGLPTKYDKDGNIIPPTEGELEQYRQAVRNTTLGVLRVRFALGFFAPASPQTNLKSDMAQWISDNGRQNWKQAFNKLLDQYPGDYDAAMAKWVELFPNELPYTITESERKTIAPLRYSQEAGDFVNQNQKLFNEYPSAAAFLIPHKTGFSWDTYQNMKSMGLISNKRVDDYLLEVQTAAANQVYYDKKQEFEDSLKNTAFDFQRTQLRKEFNAWKDVFNAAHPLAAAERSKGGATAIKRQNTLNELSNMLSQNLNIRPKTEAKLKEMLDVYNNYKQQVATFEQLGSSQSFISGLKDSVIIKMKELSVYNENTKAAYDVLFGRLLGE